MAKNKKDKPKVSKQPRERKVTVMFTDEEMGVIEKYLDKYKIQNRSRWFRETLLTHILRVYDEDYPTLFSENEMRR